MKHMNKHRWMACFLACVMALVSLAPMAEAGNRKGRRYKGGQRDYSESRYRGHSEGRHRGPGRYIVRRSNSGAIIAGFLGGVFLGATLANAAPRGYAYEDPYCGGRYHTLNSYYSHCGSHRHGREVRVVAISATFGSGGYDHYGDDNGYGPNCGPDYEYRDYRPARERHWCNDCDQWYSGGYDDHRRYCDRDDD